MKLQVLKLLFHSKDKVERSGCMKRSFNSAESNVWGASTLLLEVENVAPKSLKQSAMYFPPPITIFTLDKYRDKTRVIESMASSQRFLVLPLSLPWPFGSWSHAKRLCCSVKARAMAGLLMRKPYYIDMRERLA